MSRLVRAILSNLRQVIGSNAERQAPAFAGVEIDAYRRELRHEERDAATTSSMLFASEKSTEGAVQVSSTPSETEPVLPEEAPTEVPSTSFGRLHSLMFSVLPSIWTDTRKKEPDKVESEQKPKEVEVSKSKVLTKAERIALAKRISERRLLAAKRGATIVRKLRQAESSSSRCLHLSQLSNHLLQSAVVAAGAERVLLNLQAQAKRDSEEMGHIRSCLALVGHVQAPKGRGVRILSIDGGGTRGMMSLEILMEIERLLNGKKIHECFDLIIGVSTGAIMAALIGAHHMPIERVMHEYRRISTKLFNRARLSGYSTLFWSHSYYDTTFWVQSLKEVVGEKSMMDLICIVSCVVNTAKLEPFMFRNYGLPTHGRQSAYAGSCKYALWQALQASAAAPGYFEEVYLDGLVHQDGGVLQNNPTALALHEAKALWPEERLQCVVSIGNGQSMPSTPTIDGTMYLEHLSELLPARATSLTEKIIKIVDSATDTELVHTALASLLDGNTYFRLNPHMTHVYMLDEIAPERLEQMQKDAHMYIRRNTPKLRAVAATLSQDRSLVQKARDRVNSAMYFYRDAKL